MIRATTAAFLTLALVGSSAQAQDAATRKANRAIHAQERVILNYVSQRVEYDKLLKGSTVTVEVQPGGVVVLSGSVMSAAAKDWAVQLVENTTGVRSVVDELAVVKNVKVYDAGSSAPVVEVRAPVPVESRIIAKP